jgi:mono/diheme cytochrome c family protein
MRRRRIPKGGFLSLMLALLLFPGTRLGALQAQQDNDEGGPKFSPEAAAIFGQRCTACHTYGKGIKVGPDLKGVTERRKRDWLQKFIHASSLMIKSGDPTATSLFAQFKQQRMPDWTDLSPKQIDDLLYYLSIGGPDIKPVDERNAQTATPADIQTGRELFYGLRPFKYAAQHCSSCHSVRGDGLRGGSLGPELTQTYMKYQDRALTAFLRHPCYLWSTHSEAQLYLSPKESFSLKAFLHSAAMRNSQGLNTTPGTGDKSHPKTAAVTVRPPSAGTNQ